MSEENLNGVSFAGGTGEGSQTTSQQPAEGGSNVEPGQETAPEFLTRAEAERLKEDILRQTQSLTDKAASRMDKRLNEELQKFNDVIAMQRENGIPITPQQESDLRLKIYDKVLKESAQSQSQGQLGASIPNQSTPTLPPEVAAQAQLVNDMTEDVFKEIGVVVEPNDPEAEMVDQSSPTAFLKSIRVAAEKKKQRVSTPAEARIASQLTGQTTDLETQYKERLSKLQGQTDAIIALKKEYRKKGLHI
jgi:hypothetical protein